MGKIVEDAAGQQLNPGDYVAVQGWRGLELAKVRRFTGSCMLCDYTYVSSGGKRIPSRLQPYLPDHSNTSSNPKYPNRMIKVLRITQEQYDTYHANL